MSPPPPPPGSDGVEIPIIFIVYYQFKLKVKVLSHLISRDAVVRIVYMLEKKLQNGFKQVQLYWKSTPCILPGHETRNVQGFLDPLPETV